MLILVGGIYSFWKKMSFFSQTVSFYALVFACCDDVFGIFFLVYTCDIAGI